MGRINTRTDEYHTPNRTERLWNDLANMVREDPIAGALTIMLYLGSVIGVAAIIVYASVVSVFGGGGGAWVARGFLAFFGLAGFVTVAAYRDGRRG